MGLYSAQALPLCCPSKGGLLLSVGTALSSDKPLLPGSGRCRRRRVPALDGRFETRIKRLCVSGDSEPPLSRQRQRGWRRGKITDRRDRAFRSVRRRSSLWLFRLQQPRLVRPFQRRSTSESLGHSSAYPMAHRLQHGLGVLVLPYDFCLALT